MALPLPVLAGGVLLGALLLMSLDGQKETPGPLPKPVPPPPGPNGAGLDPLSARLLAGLHPDARTFFLDLFAKASGEGLAFRITSGKRSCAEQNKLHAQGRTAPGPVVTKARGCQSWHVAGRAIDVALLRDSSAARLSQLGQLAKAGGAVWGGDFIGFYDGGHLEYHPGLTLRDVCPDPNKC